MSERVFYNLSGVTRTGGIDSALNEVVIHERNRI